MDDEKNGKFRQKLPEILTTAVPFNSHNNSFKKIKSNSINVIDFESTLSMKNKTICTQDANNRLFKKKEFLKDKPENALAENKQEKLNNSLYKYLENTNAINFNSAHYSNVETNSIKTKETNGTSTNHETNRHSFSMIFNLKNNSSPNRNKDNAHPYNHNNQNHSNNANQQNPPKTINNNNSQNDLKKKITSNPIGNMTIEHILNSKQNQMILKPPNQTNKISSKTENLIKNSNIEKNKLSEYSKKHRILATSLYNDLKQVFDFKYFVFK